MREEGINQLAVHTMKFSLWVFQRGLFGFVFLEIGSCYCNVGWTTIL